MPMSDSVIVVFTARPLDWILRDQGSRDWRLDPQRAASCRYLVCTQNRHNATFGAPTAPHGAGFLIGRGLEVVPSPEEPERWLIKFREFSVPDQPLPNIWGKSGHRRYPVEYTTLQELGIDLARLPDFQPVQSPLQPPGLADFSGYRPMPPPRTPNMAAPRRTEADLRARLDAILAQFDRIPDQPAPFDPMSWDEHGLPR
jgi:hypothetical protein